MTLDQLKPHLLAAGIDVDALVAALSPVLTAEDAATLGAFAAEPIPLDYVLSFDGTAAVEPVTGAEVEVAIAETVGARPVLTSLPTLQGVLSHYPDVPAATTAARPSMASPPPRPRRCSSSTTSRPPHRSPTWPTRPRRCAARCSPSRSGCRWPWRRRGLSLVVGAVVFLPPTAPADRHRDWTSRTRRPVPTRRARVCHPRKERSMTTSTIPPPSAWRSARRWPRLRPRPPARAGRALGRQRPRPAAGGLRQGGAVRRRHGQRPLRADPGAGQGPDRQRCGPRRPGRPPVHTRLEWLVLDYAILAVGAVTVPIYETSSPEQVEWILSDSGAVLAVVETPAMRWTYDEVHAHATACREALVIDEGGLDELAARGREVDDATLDERIAGISADRLATIVYTSGTTGRPKGCMQTHRTCAPTWPRTWTP